MNDEDKDNAEEEELLRINVEFEDEWNIVDRTKQLILGSQMSLDQIVETLHQPISLRDLKDDKFKQTAEGRLFAIDTASKILQEITRLQKALDKSTEAGDVTFDEKLDFASGTAESYANKNKKKIG